MSTGQTDRQTGTDGQLPFFRRSRPSPRSSTVVVVVCRPGSCSVTQSFFDDFSDLLERLSTFSAPLMIAGDFNIHVDDVTDVHAGKLTDILFCHSLRQHVTSPTHVHGHTLDLLITRDDRSVAVLLVDPPLLSDHAFVVADCSCPLPSSATSTTFRQVRNWCALDVDSFDVDLQQSELYCTPPANPKTAFTRYDQTLRQFWTGMHQSSPSVSPQDSRLRGTTANAAP